MSGRLLALVLLLAVVSASVGAGAALLLRSRDDDPRPAREGTMVATVQPAAHEAEPTAVDSATYAQSQAESTAQPPPDQQANQEEIARVPEPVLAQPAQSQVDEPRQEDGPSQSSRDVEEQQEQPEVAPLEQSDQVSLVPTPIVQGEAIALTVESLDARTVTATMGNRSWNLIETAPGVWWGVMAIPRDEESGSAEVVIDLYGEGGAWLRSLTASFVVLASTAPFEEVVLGGVGISADPAEVQRDHDVRFVEHVSVSGPARWQGPWMLPAEGEVTGVFGSKRSYDGVPSDGWHHGHDIAAQHGDPIVAPARGTVVWTGELVIHGMGVIIDHGAGVYSGYWHMSLIAVRDGTEVRPGDWLGDIGTTGLSTGPHLHWEVIIQGIDVDPVQWLGDDRPPLPPGMEVAAGSADTLQ